MAEPLPVYFRERIIRLWEEQNSVMQIVAILQSEGHTTCCSTVSKWIFRWQTNRGLKDEHRCGRISKVTDEIAAFMEEKLEEDDEVTSVELHRMIARKFYIAITAPTIRRYLRKNLKWAVVRTRFGPMISDTNKVKRHEFAKMCIKTNDNFDNVIWTDESSVQLIQYSQMMRVKVILKPKPKHVLKVNVWAGISRR